MTIYDLEQPMQPSHSGPLRLPSTQDMIAGSTPAGCSRTNQMREELPEATLGEYVYRTVRGAVLGGIICIAAFAFASLIK